MISSWCWTMWAVKDSSARSSRGEQRARIDARQADQVGGEPPARGGTAGPRRPAEPPPAPDVEHRERADDEEDGRPPAQAPATRTEQVTQPARGDTRRRQRIRPPARRGAGPGRRARRGPPSRGSRAPFPTTMPRRSTRTSPGARRPGTAPPPAPPASSSIGKASSCSRTKASTSAFVSLKFTPTTVSPRGTELPGERLERRHLLPARRAPGRPEVQQHDATAEIVEPDRPARQVQELEVRGRDRLGRAAHRKRVRSSGGSGAAPVGRGPDGAAEQDHRGRQLEQLGAGHRGQARGRMPRMIDPPPGSHNDASPRGRAGRGLTRAPRPRRRPGRSERNGSLRAAWASRSPGPIGSPTPSSTRGTTPPGRGADSGLPSRPRSASSWPSCGGALARRRGGSGRRHRRPPGVAGPGGAGGARRGTPALAVRRRRVAVGRRGEHGPEHRRAPARAPPGPARLSPGRAAGLARAPEARRLALRRGRARASPGPAPREPRGAAARLAGRPARASSGPRPAARPRTPGDGDPTSSSMRRRRSHTRRTWPWRSCWSPWPWRCEQDGPGQGRALRLGLAGVDRAVALLPRDPRRRRSARGAGRGGAPGRAIAHRLAAARAARHSRGRRARSEPCSGREGTVTPDDALYMQRFWAHDFMPLPPRDLRDLGWPVARLTTVYGGGGLRYPAPGIFLALAALGAWEALATRPSRRVDRSSCPSRPRSGRPRSTSIRSSRGWCSSSSRPSSCSRRRGRRRSAGSPARDGGALATLVDGRRAPRSPCSVSCGILPPYAPEPLKPVLRTMRQAWQPGDRVYVYYGGEKAFLYYARRYGFAAADYVLGPLRPGGPAPLPARARRVPRPRHERGWS